MSCSIHFVSKTVPGYGTTPDSSGGRPVGISPNSSRGDYTLVSDVKFSALRCVSRHTSSVCNASPSNYRRNSDFSRQNKHGFSRINRNKHIEVLDGYEDFEESEALTSKNGSLLSASGNQRFQTTAVPGPREKEVVELFRKVQAQLRERAVMKEEKRGNDSQEKSKESETVDSLLKLLRKHSVQQGRKKTNIASKFDFVMNQPEKAGPSSKEGSSSISESSSTMKHEMLDSPRPHPSRPKSNFRRRSPVPEIKFQPVDSAGSVDSVSHDNLDHRREGIDLEPVSSEGNVFDEMSEDQTPEIYNNEDDNVADEHNQRQGSNLSGIKLTDLRALAKSHGLKGFSKLKKHELVELLSGSSI